MGNCQAIDNAALLIQHPNGKVDKLYNPFPASEIMKLNTGHYVALLLTTTLYSNSNSNSSASATANKKNGSNAAARNNNTPLRITRIKLLRPTDTLALGHVYRLVTTQEVMKGLLAKKHAKMNQGKITEKEISDFEAIVKKHDTNKAKEVKHERHRSRNNTPVNSSSSSASKSRGAWQPSLKSISEAGS